ncbi:TPA: tyrosine-type recombinase/integrase [Streptococcus suis]|nr:tyrosine-type recombinase/integrase [Streptococcus suis]HEM3613200.1 tyrosine-type recombinase/integrase [Streptococcus suis]HEM3625790.1 tyrosine-type recombinase/integrase [Streptococcus suis]HEM3627774.1 tyrosine-type recombinase/integrase [Streptococcus suis]HEM3639123.1 tyrosine-type recombinase/integrase [Streptococcus suis]
MSEKRRDNKGRILKTGESQRKDGRYLYKYIDSFGEPQFVYSWKLVATDRVPAGKRDCISLREKIAELQKDIHDGIDVVGKKMTLCQLYAKQNAQRPKVRKNTETGRKYLMDILKKDKLGVRSIDSIKPSDAKEWAIRMSENGYAYQTINNYKRSLKASFYIAIQDDCVRKNPFDFQLKAVLDDDTVPKTVLTEEQEEKLLAFAKADKTYSKNYDEILILLKTGLRISEFGGLTLPDLDFENRLVNIDHQLLKDSEMGYYVETPKTNNGKRELPLTERAYQAIQRILENRGKAQPLIIGGYSNFLFLNREGLPKVAGNYEGMVRGLIKKYNKYHTDKLPNITPHSFRHTYCTNMANRGMNPNTLQYLMGHANITMTLGYYAHGTFQSAKAELERLAC